MGEHERDHLCRMLNQIAANFAYEDDAAKAAEAVASHVRRFWSAEMRSQIHEAAAAAELLPLARLALDRVPLPPASA